MPEPEFYETETPTKEKVNEAVEEAQEVKVVNSRVLSFGLVTMAAFLLALFAVMTAAFFIVSNKYVDSSERSLEQSTEILTLQRALDRAEGKLYVYEAYLTNRNVDIMRQMIARFLKETRKRSTKATVRDLENFMGTGCTLCPDHEGIGGP